MIFFFKSEKLILASDRYKCKTKKMIHQYLLIHYIDKELLQLIR